MRIKKYHCLKCSGEFEVKEESEEDTFESECRFCSSVNLELYDVEEDADG